MPHGPWKINKVKVKGPSSHVGKNEDHEKGLIEKLKLKQVTFVVSDPLMSIYEPEIIWVGDDDEVMKPLGCW